MTPWLGESCLLRRYLRTGSSGPVYGEPEEINCRMEPAPMAKLVYKNPSGVLTETAASLRMFCLGEPIPVQSQVLYEGRELRVIRCESMRGFGRHHLEVTLE